MSYGNGSTATPPINVRLDPQQLAKLDELATTLPGYKPSRSDAIREAIRRGLDAIARDGARIEDAPKAPPPAPAWMRKAAPTHIADTFDDPPAMGAKPRKLSSPKLAKTLSKAKKAPKHGASKGKARR